MFNATNNLLHARSLSYTSENGNYLKYHTIYENTYTTSSKVG